MCRSIKVLRGAEPPTTAGDIRAAALQYVRKVSGFHRPSLANQPVFDEAVERISAATADLLSQISARNAKPSRPLANTLKVLTSGLLLAGLCFAADPDPVTLWPQGALGSEGKAGPESVRIAPAGDRVVSNVHSPSLTPYLPVAGQATGAAILIAPGGGHRELWTDHEGHTLARWLVERGVAAFVLKYRLAREKGSTYTIEGHALDDTRRAVRLIRSRAAEWRISPDRLGVMGFSAGGELAALVAARPGSGLQDAEDPVDRIDGVPTFQVLVYPAIPRDLKLWAEMPPAFLVCGENDRQNISQGLPELYVAMKKAGMSAELHVYAGVPHGFGVRASNRGPVAQWPERLFEWMQQKGYLTK